MSKLTDILDYLEQKGHWLESGEIEHGGSVWTYKFQKLKRKPKKTKVTDGFTKENKS